MIKVDEGEAIGIAPHSLRAVTPSELSELMSLAGDGPIHIHAAEQVKEVEDCVASLGARPVRWLLDHAGVDERWCLIHATHMDESETRDLARSGAVAGLCPITEGNLGDGIFNAADYIGAGGRYGIGTDSNVSIGVGCGTAPARICAEIAGAGAECLRSARRVIRPDDARGDLVGRRASLAAELGQARAGRVQPTF